MKPPLPPSLQRRRLVFGLGAGWAVQTAMQPAARATPAPVRILVPYAVGGASDLLARQVAPHLERTLGSPVLVENLPGASGTLAAQQLLAAPADGRTLLVISSSETILPPVLMQSVRFQARDFRLLVGALQAPLALLGRPGLPAATLEALLARGALQSEPPLSCGHLGVGSVTHLAAEHFSRLTGLALTLVPYRGGGPMVNDLVGEQLDLTFLPLAGPLLQVLETRRLRVYGVADADHAAAVPTLAPATHRRLGAHPALRGFAHSAWLSFAVPRAVPDRVAQQLNETLQAALQTPALAQLLAQLGSPPARPESLAEAARFYEAETQRLQALARSLRLQPG
jgi:tripartite-type tricarboxylate transporter receptor subunit TctC